MSVLSTIVLAFVQGVAEFLPISSSAHLIIFRDVFLIGNGMSNNMALCFDLALHLGTLLAILIFFYKDFINIIKTGFSKGIKDKDGKIMWYIIIATIPGGLAGVLLESTIEDAVRTNYILIAIALAVVGIIIYLIDKYSKQNKSINNISMKDALIIGISQVFALIPGFSRSGTTIAAGRALGIERENAAKFSFYLSAPIVAGAVLIKIIKKSTWVIIGAHLSTFILGIIISFLVGIICIKYLLKYLKNHDFKIFMIYRIIFACIIILWLLFK